MLHPILQVKLPVMSRFFKEDKIKCAYAFGSVVSENFNDDSDIDLLISFEDGLGPLEKGEICWSLHDKLRALFNREVDIVIEGALKNPYLIEELNEKKQLIYAA